MPAHTIPTAPQPAVAVAPVVAATDRPARYEANLDKALALMAPAERLPELREERVRWIARYEEFVDRVDRGGTPHWGEHVNDYILVIALLGQRIAAEERR